MAKDITVDDELIREAQRVGRHRTKQDALTAALEAYIKHQRRVAVLDMAGKVEFWPDYDHKKFRQGKQR